LTVGEHLKCFTHGLHTSGQDDPVSFERAQRKKEALEAKFEENELQMCGKTVPGGRGASYRARFGDQGRPPLREIISDQL
jgi:hypothetical protein